MSDDTAGNAARKAQKMNRRNVLLAGTTLTAAAIAGGDSVQVAQAQPQQPHAVFLTAD
jgi:hypothetical protein